MLESEDWEAAKNALAEAMPNLILSPRAHLATSYVAGKLGDETGRKMEGIVAAACCEAIMSTGDGTVESPYVVTRTSDEHDVLQYIEKEFAGQSLVEKDGRAMDRMQCGDGTEIWFDISAPFSKLKEQFGD